MPNENSRSIVVDTNILLLVVIGQFDPALIRRFKRTSRYDAGDYDLINRFLRRQRPAHVLLTTPHILTEVSNFLGQLQEPARSHCRRIFASIIGGMAEHAEPGRNLASRSSFLTLGITDAGIKHPAGPNVTLITDDFQLGGTLEARGVEVWNLKQMRSAPL